ncbi:UNVERIFIED_CONTAM: hypothetical protein HDU68_006320, partial [Siphonaria sp. JEL0065]
MNPTGDRNDSNQAPTSPGSVADLAFKTQTATSKYSPDMIGYHINKELYMTLENHLVHLILEEALAKAKKDDKIDKEKFKRLNEFINPDNTVSDIISKLQEDDVKESFTELMEYVKGSGASSSLSENSAESDPTFIAVFGFLSDVFEGLAPFMPFGMVVFSIGKLGYKLINNGTDLRTEVHKFSETINQAINIIKLYLPAEIPEGDMRTSIVTNLNELISCVVKYFEYYVRDYYQNDSGKKFQMRDLNLPKTIKLKKDFGEIKESFETAHKFLTDTIQAVNFRFTIANGNNRFSPPSAVIATFPHTYPLQIEVVNFENTEGLEFVVPDNCKTGNLVEM